jgi:Na+/phosphate symporter
VAVSAFATGDEELGLRARRMIAQIEADDLRLRRSHIERLHRSEKASIESSSIHLDVLTDLARIASLLTAMVEASSRPRGQEPGVP